MLEYIQQETNKTYTENGAVTNASTGSDCLDLFATIGALRRESDEEIITRFIRAFSEDRDSAMKLLFFGRDVRGGLGERRVFRVILQWLAKNEPASVRNNLSYIAEYGRWDDVLCLLNTPCEADMFRLVKGQFDRDMEALKAGDPVSLLGKWLPSVNASNRQTVYFGKRIAKAFGLTDAAYRKALSELRTRIKIIENNLRERDYTFDYETQPSRALFKYRSAFYRHDSDRYTDFLSRVNQGKATMHTDGLAPYELVEPYLTYNYHCFMKPLTDAEKDVLNTTWASLPDFGSTENALAVIDTSGSMYCDGKPLPAAVALSLGLYFAERNAGVYKNCFIEFSSRPRLVELKGDTFADKLRYAATFNEVGNTDIEAVFDLVLDAAVNNHVPQEEMPAKLIIISDMEFDACVRNAKLSNFRNAQERFAAHGYRLPQIVFWNVASRNRQQPVTQNEQGVALVSGVTPRIFSMIAGGILSPYAFMQEVLGSERYAVIAA